MSIRISSTRRYVCFLLAMALVVGLIFVPEHAYAAKNKKVKVYVIAKETYKDKGAGYTNNTTYTYNKNGLIRSWKSDSDGCPKMTFYYKKNRITSVKYDWYSTIYYKPKYRKGRAKSIAVTVIDSDGEKRNTKCVISRNKNGRVVKMVDDIFGYTATNTYKYNKKGLIIKTTGNDSDSSFGVTYKYDKKNRIAAINGEKLKKKNNRYVRYICTTYKYKKITVPEKNVPEIIKQQNYILGYHDCRILMF